MSRAPTSAALLLGLLCSPCIVPAAANAACPDVPVAAAAVPHMRQSLETNREIVIVTLGSSSTEGAFSSDIAHSYPAILQSDLTQAFPKAHIAVINRGVGGQDAVEETPRIESDVLAIKPTLIIWQVGANGVLQHLDPALFKKLVTHGVQRMRDAGADVILMDNQRAPRLIALVGDPVIDRAMADVALKTNVSLFARSALMDAWKAAGYPYASFMASDGLHHNDLGYRCVAHALAISMIQGLTGPPPTPTSFDSPQDREPAPQQVAQGARTSR